MRIAKADGALRAQAISGTRVVLIALDITDPEERKGFRGFAIHREGGARQPDGSGSQIFEDLVPIQRRAIRIRHTSIRCRA